MKNLSILILVISIFFLMGCDEENVEPEPEPEPVNTLKAHAGADQQTEINKLVTLNGSGSKDTDNGNFQYEWSLKSKPDNSMSSLTDADKVSAIFTPDKEGEYVVELKIYNVKFEDRDEVKITANAPENPPPPPVAETIVIDQDINEERRLTNIFDDLSKPDYLVTEDIHVTGYLTIDPNVIIAFEQDKAMYIDNPGSILTLGHGANEVVFTGKEKTPGFWKGLVINSSSSFNLLEGTVIEYGGSNPADGLTEPANLAVNDAGQGYLRLKYSTIQFSSGYGMIIEPGAFLSKDNLQNQFKNNLIPLSLPAFQLGSLSALNYFLDNTKNFVEVIGTPVNSNELTRWSRVAGIGPSTIIPYVVKGNIEVRSGLQIHEGAAFYFEEDAEFIITQNYL